MNSKEMRFDPLFMRNTFSGGDRWEIPFIKKQPLISDKIALIAYSDTRLHDLKENCQKGVHFFLDDYRFNVVYNQSRRVIQRLSQYTFLLTPDYSTYADMQPWRQLESVAHSRWCGAYWQSLGFVVYPTITWSTPCSYYYCFDGIERNAIVAIGMNGATQNNRKPFVRGYDAMLEHISPEAIICLGTPFPEMRGHIICVDYHYPKGVK